MPLKHDSHSCNIVQFIREHQIAREIHRLLAGHKPGPAGAFALYIKSANHIFFPIGHYLDALLPCRQCRHAW
jgi:hypothetical protein